MGNTAGGKGGSNIRGIICHAKGIGYNIEVKGSPY